MVIGIEAIKKLLIRYNGIGKPLTHDEREILLFALYNESEARHGIAAEAAGKCDEYANSHPPKYDYKVSGAEKAEAINRVDRHANPRWKEAAFEALISVCFTTPRFIVDAVWLAMEVREGVPFTYNGTHDPRAMGGILPKGKRLGLCRKVKGQHRESKRRGCHHNLTQLWESLICESTDGAEVEDDGGTP